MRHHGIGLLLAVMLVVACVNPCGALESTSPQQPDRGVLVWGDDGNQYALISPASNPLPYFDSVKPGDVLHVVSADGITATLQYYAPLDNTTGGSGPLLGANAQHPLVIIAGDAGAAIATYVIESDVITIFASGAVFIAGTVYSSADSHSVELKTKIANGAGTPVSFREGAVNQLRTSIAFGSDLILRFKRDLDNTEIDYNDAKEKGIPAKNHKDETGHRIENDADYIGPYMSVSLFRDQTDKDNGCPKQIRYYGKDGKAEVDIDFAGDVQHGPYPHKQRWINGVREVKPNFDGIEKIRQYWKCRNYDFQNHRFKKGDL